MISLTTSLSAWQQNRSQLLLGGAEVDGVVIAQWTLVTFSTSLFSYNAAHGNVEKRECAVSKKKSLEKFHCFLARHSWTYLNMLSFSNLCSEILGKSGRIFQKYCLTILWLSGENNIIFELFVWQNWKIGSFDGFGFWHHQYEYLYDMNIIMKMVCCIWQLEVRVFGYHGITWSQSTTETVRAEAVQDWFFLVLKHKRRQD